MRTPSDECGADLGIKLYVLCVNSIVVLDLFDTRTDDIRGWKTNFQRSFQIYSWNKGFGVHPVVYRVFLVGVHPRRI